MKKQGALLAGGLSAAIIAALMPQSNLFAATSCESLKSLTLPATMITLAQVVPAGGFSLRLSESECHLEMALALYWFYHLQNLLRKCREI